MAATAKAHVKMGFRLLRPGDNASTTPVKKFRRLRAHAMPSITISFQLHLFRCFDYFHTRLHDMPCRFRAEGEHFIAR